ncbi:MAG: precorrin-8X methylmutase [Thermodesulfobacteriota bacterium]
MRPEDIESLSFQIIEQEAGQHGLPPGQWRIVRRMIHTSADFEYIETVRFHPDALSRGLSALESGAEIITDTRMALAGINTQALAPYGCKTDCLISDPAVAALAGKTGGTRAAAAVDAALERINGCLYVIGNAPTALLRLLEVIREKGVSPALVVGFPVGFVNAAESKAELIRSDVPHISNQGRKGGSNIAASAVNALVRMLPLGQSKSGSWFRV